MYAIGGLTACLIAASLEYQDQKKIDPNIFFGIYASIIAILLIASLSLNYNLEPDIVLK
jgi:hypothetical protein